MGVRELLEGARVMALPKFMHDDPANAIDRLRNDKHAREEVKDCGGCIHKTFYFGELYCTKGRKNLQRCSDYNNKGD